MKFRIGIYKFNPLCRSQMASAKGVEIASKFHFNITFDYCFQQIIILQLCIYRHVANKVTIITTYNSNISVHLLTLFYKKHYSNCERIINKVKSILKHLLIHYQPTDTLSHPLTHCLIGWLGRNMKITQMLVN
jgi:hypothetical protein